MHIKHQKGGVSSTRGMHGDTPSSFCIDRKIEPGIASQFSGGDFAPIPYAMRGVASQVSGGYGYCVMPTQSHQSALRGDRCEDNQRIFIDYGRYFVPDREQQPATLCVLVPPSVMPFSLLELGCGTGRRMGAGCVVERGQ